MNNYLISTCEHLHIKDYYGLQAVTVVMFLIHVFCCSVIQRVQTEWRPSWRSCRDRSCCLTVSESRSDQSNILISYSVAQLFSLWTSDQRQTPRRSLFYSWPLVYFYIYQTLVCSHLQSVIHTLTSHQQQFWVQYLTQGHFSMQTRGIEPATFH